MMASVKQMSMKIMLVILCCCSVLLLYALSHRSQWIFHNRHRYDRIYSSKQNSTLTWRGVCDSQQGSNQGSRITDESRICSRNSCDCATDRKCLSKSAVLGSGWCPCVGKKGCVGVPTDPVCAKDTNTAVRIVRLVCLLMFLTVRLKCQRHENIKNNENTAIFRFLGLNISLKWHLSLGDSHGSSVPGDVKDQCVYDDESKHFSFKPFCKPSSEMNVLYEYIFHPWRLKAGVESSGPTFCHNVKEEEIPECQDTGNLCNPNLLTINVNPVTRFLPDPSFNPDVDFTHLGYRLASLGALPSSVPVSRVRLANAGFYFAGQNAEVTCPSCHVCHSDWSSGRDPMDIHRELSPHCEFVLASDREAAALSGGTPEGDHVEDADHPNAQTSNGHSEAQTPATFSRSITTTSTNMANDQTGTGDVQGSVTSMVNLNTSTATSGSGDSSALLVVVTGVGGATNAGSTSVVESVATASPARSGTDTRRNLFPQASLGLGDAVYPMYLNLTVRRRSFTHAWDETRAPPLEDVLNSGMFYGGYADCVRCFFCGVSLKSWAASDDVWTEHVRWRPGCGYLQAVRGDDFIRDMQRKLGIVGQTSQPTTPTTSTTTSATASSFSSLTAAAPTSSEEGTTHRTTNPSAVITWPSAATPSSPPPPPPSSGVGHEGRSEEGGGGGGGGRGRAVEPPGALPSPQQDEAGVGLQAGDRQLPPADQNEAGAGLQAGDRQLPPADQNEAGAGLQAGDRQLPPADQNEAGVGLQAGDRQLPPADQNEAGAGLQAGDRQLPPADRNEAGAGLQADERQLPPPEQNEGGAGLQAGDRQLPPADRNEAGAGLQAGDRQLPPADQNEGGAGLQADHRHLAPQFRCHQCHAAAINTLLIPCGHLVVCETCAAAMRTCPMCGATVQATARVYLNR